MGDDMSGGRRARRARSGVKPLRLDLAWEFVGWFSVFPGSAMILFAFGGGRRRAGPPMGVEQTWIGMLVAAACVFVLVLALAARRAAGVVPRRYPGMMFGLIIFVAIAAPVLAWVRLHGEISDAGWSALGLCAGVVVLSAIMLVPPRDRGR